MSRQRMEPKQKIQNTSVLFKWEKVNRSMFTRKRLGRIGRKIGRKR